MSTQSEVARSVAAPATQQSSSARMIITMGGIGFVCGLLIVLTFRATFPVIEKNKADALKRAVLDVVPGAESMAVFGTENDRLVPVDGSREGVKYFACYDSEQRFVGVAIEAKGQGYQDVIHVIYGYSPAASAIVGMKVLESKETPGLGDKIDKDARFRSNFERLVVELDPKSRKIVNPITLAKFGEKTDDWQVEAITGATISSRAVTSILEKSTAVAVPIINDNLDTLEGGGE